MWRPANLYKSSQSAYRKEQSVDTALVRIQNDLLHATDKHCVSCLMLVDLSAALTLWTIYSILLQRLSGQIGFA